MFSRGLSATAEGFADTGIPLPTASAYVTAFLEVVGGGLVVLGLFTSLLSGLLAITMVRALMFAHAEDGLVGGYEFVLTVGLLCLVLAAFGPGKFSLGEVLARTKKNFGTDRRAELAT